MYQNFSLKDYVFCHRSGGLRMSKADPLLPETWPFPKEEVTRVFADCTVEFFPEVSCTYIQNRIRELLDYIRLHFQESLTMDFALEMTGMSQSNFYRHFKLETGMPLVSYINKVKIEQAARLLIETDLTCSAISYDCGFDSLSQFFKCFKEHFGVPPGKYRKVIA